MPIDKFSIPYNSTTQLPVNEGESITPLYLPLDFISQDDLGDGAKILSRSVSINDINIIASISSIAAAPLPDIQNTDSDVQRLEKVLEIEWTHPRIELDIFFKEFNANWLEAGTISLLNSFGYPYRNYYPLEVLSKGKPLRIAEDTLIGFKFEDAGYGLPADFDYITIHYSLDVEYVMLTKSSSITIINNTTSTDSNPPNNNISYSDFTRDIYSNITNTSWGKL